MNATLDRPVSEKAGTQIGPYKLLQQIGEGGFGVVFMAEQQQPVRRTVALKVIKPGMDTRHVIARFESERQALAIMDHPNIAKVLDAGATESGLPYFVMELVKGVPITEFCDKNHMAAEGRLKLFIDVCHAIQHAHQKGIIHRDIKPTNVMVTLHDGVPVVKVIDFGVAKATAAKLTERTLFTGFGQMIGTPAYMSPEQAEMSGLDIDTRSDIFSLGVLLYELLIGTTPLDMQQLRQAGYAEMQRMIRDDAAPRPSTRLSSLGDSATVFAGNRGMDVKQLVRLVSGDLDWIVMKSLEKDRNRRYETANGFAADVQRYLNDEPVVACPPSAWYLLGKFARRHRGPLWAAIVVMLALLVGLMGTGWGFIEAMRQRDVGRERLVEVEQANAKTTQALADLLEANTKTETALEQTKQAKAATEQALTKSEESRKQAEAVANYLVEVFRSPDPLKDSREIKVVELLDRAAEWLDKEFVGDPATKGKLLNALAQTYLGLGLIAQAVPLHEQARAVRREALGPDHPETLESMNNLALAYNAAGRRAEALPLFEQTLELRKAKLGPDHFDTLSSMNNLGDIYRDEGRHDKALPLYEEAFKLLRAKFPDHIETFISLNARLSGAYHFSGQQPKFVRLVEETIKLLEGKVSADKFDALKNMKKQSESMKELFVQPLGVDAIREGLPLQEEGPPHDAIPKHLVDLVLGALPQQEESLKEFKVVFGPDHPNTLNAMFNLGNAYMAVGRLQDGLLLLEETLKLRKAKLGPDHPVTLGSMNMLAAMYWHAGRLQEALSLHEERLKLIRAKLGPDDPETLTTIRNMAHNYLAAKQPEQAIPLLGEFLAGQRKRLGPDDPGLADILASVGLDLLKHQQYVEAEKVLRECLLIREQKQPDDWMTFNTKSMLGGSLAGQKNYAEAEPLLLAGYEGLNERQAQIPAAGKIRIPEAIQRLIDLYDAWGKPDQAAEWRKKLEATKSEAVDRNQ